MYKVHGYLDEKRVINWRMEHLPRVGDTMRFAGEKYGRVTEVVWCMDEPSQEGQRVNLRVESDPANKEVRGATRLHRRNVPLERRVGGAP